jgi:hypothetical protein
MREFPAQMQSAGVGGRKSEIRLRSFVTCIVDPESRMYECLSGYPEVSARKDAAMTAALTVATIRSCSHSRSGVWDIDVLMFGVFVRALFPDLSCSCRSVSCSIRCLTIAAMPERGVNHSGALSL